MVPQLLLSQDPALMLNTWHFKVSNVQTGNYIMITHLYHLLSASKNTLGPTVFPVKKNYVNTNFSCLHFKATL